MDIIKFFICVLVINHIFILFLRSHIVFFLYVRLQKFKVQTANTVISGENSRLESMGTEQLLDLFSHKSGSTTNGSGSGVRSGAGGGGVKAILETLPDLWDQKQYEDEYDLSQFMTKLK